MFLFDTLLFIISEFLTNVFILSTNENRFNVMRCKFKFKFSRRLQMSDKLPKFVTYEFFIG